MNNMSDYIPFGYDRNDKEKEEEFKKETILRQYLTRKAKERLANLSLVNPGLVKRVKDLIVSLVISNKISEPITDDQLKGLLYEMQKNMKKEYRFRGLW